jgi:hypothetical protein
MPLSERIAGTLSIALACAALLCTSAQADSGRSCEPRPLTEAEKAAGERIADTLRESLPSAPPGWTVHDNPPTLASGTCEEKTSAKAASGKRVLLPVSVSVSRGFRREGEPAATAPAGAQAPAQPASDAGAQARVEALQKEIAELQRKDRAALAAYQAARRAGDSPAQKEAGDASRRYRAEMKPLQNELRVLRNEMRAKRAGAAQAKTRQAQQRMQAARADRRDASVSIHANLRQQDVYPARRVDVGNAPLALRDGAGATHLFYGPWRRSGNFAVASIDDSGATTRVQAVSVRIDANEPMTEALLGKLDLDAVRKMVAPASSPGAPLAQAALAPVEISLQVGSEPYRSRGEGGCKAASQASIYGVNASLHSVSHSAGDRSLNLSLWQPKDRAPDMMSLHVSTGSARYLVDTVKAGAKRDTKGSGKATLQKAGAGGLFSIDAVAASGEKITGTIRCGRFGGVQAEGG